MAAEVLEDVLVKELDPVEEGDNDCLLVRVETPLDGAISIERAEIVHLQEWQEFASKGLQDFDIDFARTREYPCLEYISCPSNVETRLIKQLILRLPHDSLSEHAVIIRKKRLSQGCNCVAFLEFELPSEDIVKKEVQNAILLSHRPEISCALGEDEQRPYILLVCKGELLVCNECLE